MYIQVLTWIAAERQKSLFINAWQQTKNRQLCRTGMMNQSLELESFLLILQVCVTLSEPIFIRKTDCTVIKTGTWDMKCQISGKSISESWAWSNNKNVLVELRPRLVFYLENVYFLLRAFLTLTHLTSSSNYLGLILDLPLTNTGTSNIDFLLFFMFFFTLIRTQENKYWCFLTYPNQPHLSTSPSCMAEHGTYSLFRCVPTASQLQEVTALWIRYASISLNKADYAWQEVGHENHIKTSGCLHK